MDGFLIQNSTLAVIGFLTVVAIVIVVIVLALRERVTLRKQNASQLQARELAKITEEISMTGWGGFCVVMLVLTVAGSIGSYAAAKTVFQQIEAGVSLMAGLILFGLGSALGRRRTYTIYRSEQRTD
jgi:cytochrome b561